MSTFHVLDENSDHTSFDDLKFDDKTFESFFKERFIPLCSYCQYRFGFTLDEAKEVVHTGFIKLWETRHILTPGLSAKAYLYKIVTNNCLDILKHEKIKDKHADYVLKNTSSNYTLDKDFNLIDLKQLRLSIEKAVGELPEQMRIIFMLSRYEGLKYIEIAHQLDISVKTVETQMCRALVKLKQKLALYLTASGITLLLSL